MTELDVNAVRARGAALISEARGLGEDFFSGDIFGGVDHIALSRASAKFSAYFVDAANAIAAAKMEPEACTEAELQGVVTLELLMKRAGKLVRDALVRPDGVCAVDIIGGRSKKTANTTHTVVPKRAREPRGGGATAAVQFYTGDDMSTCLWDDEGAKIRRIIKVVAAFIEDVDKVAFQPVVPGSHAVTVGAVVVNIEGDVLYNKAITMERTKTGPYFLNDMVASWVQAQELTHEAVFFVPECPSAKRVIVMMPHQLYVDGPRERRVDPLAHPDYPDVRLVPVFACTNVAGNKKGMSVKLGTSRLRQLFSEEEAPAIINEVYELDCRQINNKKQKPSSDTA